MQRTAIFIPVTVIGLLVLPMALTSRSFGSDWTLHLWLVRQQQWNIRAMGHPGLFVSAKPLGAFYPIFAFVGSGAYSVGGYLAILLGDRPILAYKMLYLAGLCLGYGGMTWLSVQRGLRRWRSQVAGLVYVTGAHVVIDLAGSGDLGEFLGLASIPFLLAAASAIVSSPRFRLRHFLALVVAVFVFTGSHNITLLWGTLFITAIGAVALVAYAPRLRPPVPWKRLGALLGAATIGAGLNAWYLLPDLKYAFGTMIATTNGDKLPGVVDRYGFLWGLLRPQYAMRVTIPWLFVVWALVAAFASWRGTDAVSRRVFVGVLALGGAFVWFTADQSPWKALPHLFYNVQATRRLNAYVLLSTALLVMVALGMRGRAHSRATRALPLTLAAMLVLTVGLANWQLWHYESSYHVKGRQPVPAGKSFNDRVVHSRTVIPPSWYTRDEFRDITSPYIFTTAKQSVTVPLGDVHGSSFSGVLDVPDGPGPFRTNISAGPRFVRMTGIRAVGRTIRGFVVAVRSADVAPTGPVAVTIEQADTKIFRLGSIVSLLSALALLATMAWPLRRLVSRLRPPNPAGDRSTRPEQKVRRAHAARHADSTMSSRNAVVS